MELSQLFQNFQYEDLQWVVPVFAGLLIIVGALLAGIIRGMSAGVIIAIFFGGLMAMAPTLVTLVEPQGDRLAEVNSKVTQSAAQLATINNEVSTDLARAMTTLRRAVADLRPALDQTAAAQTGQAANGQTANGQTDNGQAASGQFSQSIEAAEQRLNEAIDTLSNSANARTQLEADLQELQVELRRLDLQARRGATQ